MTRRTNSAIEIKKAMSKESVMAELTRLCAENERLKKEIVHACDGALDCNECPAFERCRDDIHKREKGPNP